jgi:hypothetical protein
VNIFSYFFLIANIGYKGTGTNTGNGIGKGAGIGNPFGNKQRS